MHPAQFDRKALEQAYIGLVCDNRRLKEKARAHKRNIKTMQNRYHVTKLELEALRNQVEEVIVVDTRTPVEYRTMKDFWGAA
uniref:Uncharacterized protein n=1 Tax=viral metagenome TaxID=1070528 RepID=A0A6M3IK56_9ZZZZ